MTVGKHTRKKVRTALIRPDPDASSPRIQYNIMVVGLLIIIIALLPGGNGVLFQSDAVGHLTYARGRSNVVSERAEELYTERFHVP